MERRVVARRRAVLLHDLVDAGEQRLHHRLPAEHDGALADERRGALAERLVDDGERLARDVQPEGAAVGVQGGAKVVEDALHANVKHTPIRVYTMAA